MGPEAGTSSGSTAGNGGETSSSTPASAQEQPISDSGSSEQPQVDSTSSDTGSNDEAGFSAEGSRPSLQEMVAGVKRDAGAKIEDFDGIGLKDGMQLSGDQLLHIKRGYLRNKDYTTKAQRLAKYYDDLQGWYQGLYKNPNQFFQHFKPETVVQWLQQIGYNVPQNSSGSATPKEDSANKTAILNGIDLNQFEEPAQKVMMAMNEQISKQNAQLEKMNSWISGMDKNISSSRETYQKQQAYNELATELKTVVDSHPELNNKYDRQTILASISVNPHKSAMEIANELMELKRQGKVAKVENIKQNGPTRVGGTGMAQPEMATPNRSIFDARKSAAKRLGLSDIHPILDEE